MSNLIRENIGDGIELLIEGIPQSALSPISRTRTILRLFEKIFPPGIDLVTNVVGKTMAGTFKIRTQHYEFTFQFTTMRALKALDVYAAAIQWIEFQMFRGTLDEQLGRETIAYLREDLRRKQKKWLEENR